MRDLQPVSIGGIEFDALISSEESYNAEVPIYPVDSGFSVSDNVAIEALEITLVLVLSSTPVTWLASHGSGEERIRTVCDQLLEEYKEREPLTLVTRDKTFENMVIKSISISKSDEALLSREVQVTLSQITVTSSAEAEVPAKLAKSGTTKSNAGSASTTRGSGSSSGSSGSSGSRRSSSGGGSGSSSGGSSSSSGSSGSNSVTSLVNAVTGNGYNDNRTPFARVVDTASTVASNAWSAVGGWFS